MNIRHACRRSFFQKTRKGFVLVNLLDGIVLKESEPDDFLLENTKRRFTLYPVKSYQSRSENECKNPSSKSIEFNYHYTVTRSTVFNRLLSFDYLYECFSHRWNDSFGWEARYNTECRLYDCLRGVAFSLHFRCIYSKIILQAQRKRKRKIFAVYYQIFSSFFCTAMLQTFTQIMQSHQSSK